MPIGVFVSCCTELVLVALEAERGRRGAGGVPGMGLGIGPGPRPVLLGEDARFASKLVCARSPRRCTFPPGTWPAAVMSPTGHVT